MTVHWLTSPSFMISSYRHYFGTSHHTKLSWLHSSSLNLSWVNTSQRLISYWSLTFLDHLSWSYPGISFKLLWHFHYHHTLEIYNITIPYHDIIPHTIQDIKLSTQYIPIIPYSHHLDSSLYTYSSQLVISHHQWSLPSTLSHHNLMSSQSHD
jgi:hypothetical protein